MPRGVLSVVLVAAALANLACPTREDASPAADRLIVGAYTAPRDVLEEAIFPAFRAAWRARTGRDVETRASYLGSGAQARAVIEGFAADVVILALEPDVERLVAAGLVAPDWRARAGHDGIVARTLVVVAVRAGNPRGVRGFADLREPDLELLTPNPRTSGVATWNLLALYGAALRGAVRGMPADDRAAAARFVGDVMDRVVVLDKGARESLVNFERGIGDVAITYEQEIFAARRAGRFYDYVVPPATILAEVPAAVVDRNVDAHGRRALAEAFLAFVSSPSGQAMLRKHGFRPASGAPGASVPGFPPAGAPFLVDDFGGWPAVMKDLFGRDGLLTRVIEERAR